MTRLAVNIDHVATIREARRESEPEPVTAASLAELAGCDGIITHLREDRRHIHDRDVELLRKTVKTKLNLEMAPTDEITKIALKLQPDMCTLVPEKREELTTEGGLDVMSHFQIVRDVVARLQRKRIQVSLFIDPKRNMIEAAKEMKADYIEIHTGIYSNSRTADDIERELKNIEESALFAAKLGLGVNAGHGLDYYNIKRLTHIKEIEEFSIGHSIIARAVLVGLERAVREMLLLIQN